MKRLILVTLTLLCSPYQALALTSETLHKVQYDAVYYSTASFCAPGGGTNTPPSTTGDPSAGQEAVAKAIIGIAKTDNLNQNAALIGLMVGLDESGLKIYANSNVPISLTNPAHTAVGSDHDSVGVFQQRPSTGWSTLAPQGGPAALTNKDAVFQLMDPAYSAEAFFGSPPGSHAPGPLSKGLQNHPGWESLPPWVAAQKVQASGTASGLNYQKHLPAAQGFIDRLWASSPPVPLPVSITTATTTGGGGGDTSGSPCGPVSTNGCVNPFLDPAWGLSRTDQGVDFIPNKPLPVLAICDGDIVSTDGHGWPGGVFIYYKLTSGPFIGKCIFVAEHLTNSLPAGTHVKAGDTIATALPGKPFTEWGWAQGSQTPSTPYNGSPDGTPMPGGKAFARFLRGLGAQTQMDPGPGPSYDGASCK